MNHIVAPEVGSCWMCGLQTRFIEINFQTFFHPGECTDKAWTEYDKAMRHAGPIDMSLD